MSCGGIHQNSGSGSPGTGQFRNISLPGMGIGQGRESDRPGPGLLGLFRYPDRIFFRYGKFLLLSVLSFAQPKEIKTVAILGDSYSTFDGYIPEGNACWYFTTPQGENDVVSVEQTWWYQFCEEGGYELLMN